MHLISDLDDLISEKASKALSLAYDLTTREFQVDVAADDTDMDTLRARYGSLLLERYMGVLREEEFRNTARCLMCEAKRPGNGARAPKRARLEQQLDNVMDTEPVKARALV